MSDDLIKVPSFLAAKATELGISPRCSFCVEVACETDAMACGQCSGQSCSGQCTSAECGQCGSCERGQCGSCQSSCQGCQTTCEVLIQESPLPGGSITNISSTATSITIRYSGVSGADWYQVVYRKANESALSYIANAKNLSCVITGLEPNTSYTVNYRAVSSSGMFGDFASGRTISTKSPTPASFSITDISTTDITIRVSVGSSTEFIVYCTTPAGREIWNKTVYSESNFNHTITGLIPNTSYKVNVHYDVGNAWCSAKEFTTASDRPEDWDWGYQVKPGARLPTALEWDNFRDRVNEFREYKGLSAHSFVRAYPGPTTLTAAMVNQAIEAIRAMSPPTAPPENTVKNVTKLSAALLNGLAGSLNSL